MHDARALLERSNVFVQGRVGNEDMVKLGLLLSIVATL
jgi:hypothetical protein